MAVQAFDLAERLQTPGDRALGPRHRHERLDVPRPEVGRRLSPDRGKMLSKEEIAEAREVLPLRRQGRRRHHLSHACRACTRKAAYFTRGSGHTQYGGYTEDSTEYQLVLDRLKRKCGTAKKLVPRAVIEQRAASRRRHRLARQLRRRRTRGHRHPQGTRRERRTTCACAPSRSARTSSDFLAAHELLFVVEQNRDAQLRALLTLETAVDKAKLRSILHYSGLPISSACIVEGVLAEAAAAGPQPGITGAASCKESVMTYLPKPKVAHPSLPKNELGLTRRDYEGAHVDAVRRLRPRLHHRRDHRGLLGAVDSSRRTW